MVRPWPLTGRDEELLALTTAIRPDRGGILVAGRAGVGKTRLVREAVAHATARGTRVVWAFGSRAAGAFPFGAFAGLADVPVGDASGAVNRVLDDLVRRGPLVLAVDDAHLLDELSAVVLHRVVVRRLAPVVVTVRDGEPAPDSVTALWKDDLLPRHDLAELDRATTTTLLANVLQGPVETASAHRLWTLTRGSPLFLRHVVAGEVAAGRLSPASGVWCWSGGTGISPEVASLLEQQIGALAPPVQDVVDLVTLGEPVAVGTLAGLCPSDAVEQAERRGLVQVDTSGDPVVVRLVHPLYGEVRRAAMGGLRARRLRGLLAGRLDGATDPLPRAVLVLGSDLEPDPPLFLRAAQAAIGFHDLPLAERLARAAVAGGDWTARLVHASALSWLTRGEEAEAVLRDLAATAPSPALRAWAHVHRTGNLLWSLGRAEQARDVLQGALDDPGPGPARLQAEAMAAALHAARGESASALELGLALLEQDGLDDLARLVALSAVAAAAAVRGRLDLLDVVSRDPAGPSRVPHGIPVFGLSEWLVTGYRLAGVPATGEQVVRDLVSASADLPGPARPMALVVAGDAALGRGRVRDALVPLREAWALLEPSDHEFRFRCRTLLATALGMAGQPTAARAVVDEIAVRRHPAYTLTDPEDRVAQAWGAAAEGAVTEAVRCAAAAAALAREQASPAYEVLAWQTATQLGGAADAAPRLAVLAEEVVGPRAGAALAHARAWSAQDADGLTAAADGWELLEDLVAAGDAAAQAADVHRRQGRHGSAMTSAARADGLARRSGARTPALATAARPLPLTVREREIAVLAAGGLTNREIATRLTVSVRTVEGHLYRAGHKLGVARREQLADVLGPAGASLDPSSGRPG